MMSAASQRASMASRSGPHAYSVGRILNSRADSTPTSAIEVRELVSRAIDRTSCIGFVVYTATDATGPRDAIDRSGTMRNGPPRRYSIDGIRPTSIVAS